MNNHGSRKVLQWKLDIQHFDATIEHVPGKANVPADVFSRLVVRHTSIPIHHILGLQCTSTQRNLIERFHTYLYAHWGVETTLALMVHHSPNETNWPHIRNDVRQYVQSCSTCQKWTPRIKPYGRPDLSCPL